MKKSRLTLTTKKIAYIAVLVAINLVLNPLGIDIGYATKLSFTYIPCFIAGIFMGPFAGFLVGAIGDGLGFLISPKGVWLPLITLASGLMGLIPGILCSPKIKLHIFIKIAISLMIVFIVCTAGLNTYAIYRVYSGGETFFAYLIYRMTMGQPIIFAINAAAIYLLYYPLKKLVFKKDRI